MRRILFCTCLIVVALAAGCSSKPSDIATKSDYPRDVAQATPAGTKTPSTPTVFGLTDDIVVLPIKMSDEFPMVEAKINDTVGRLMFDTGQEDALNINDKAVPLQGGKVIGSGFFESGEKFEVKRYPTISSVELGGSLFYHDIPDVKGQGLGEAEGFGGIFLGFIGHHFYDGYLFKLDYSSKQITFYKQTEARRTSKDFLKNETVVAIIPFETRKLPNHPIISVKIGDEPFVGSFDTGQIGGAYMDKTTRVQLSKKRLLTPTAGSKGAASDFANVTFTPTLTVSVSGIPVSEGQSLAAEPIGITEKNEITFGYAFLSQYKTIWDFSDKKIYLLKP